VVDRAQPDEAPRAGVACQSVEGVLGVGDLAAVDLVHREAVTGRVERVLEAREERRLGGPVLDVHHAVERVVAVEGGCPVRAGEARAVARGVVAGRDLTAVAVGERLEAAGRAPVLEGRAAGGLDGGDALVPRLPDGSRAEARTT